VIASFATKLCDEVSISRVNVFLSGFAKGESFRHEIDGLSCFNKAVGCYSVLIEHIGAHYAKL
jgi:hypothetical protein